MVAILFWPHCLHSLVITMWYTHRDNLGQNWGFLCQKQVSRAWMSNYIPQYPVRCTSNYIHLPQIPASGTNPLNCGGLMAWCQCVGEKQLEVNSIAIGHVTLVTMTGLLDAYSRHLLWKSLKLITRSGPMFCLLLRVSSGCARPITGQVTSVIWLVIGWA